MLENNGGIFAGGIEALRASRTSHSEPQLQRGDRQRPADRQRRPDPLRRPRDLLRLQQLRRRPTTSCARTSASSTAPASRTSGSAPAARSTTTRSTTTTPSTPAPASRSRPSCRSAAALGDGSGSGGHRPQPDPGNYTGDDGGGIFVLDALDAPVNIRNNMIVDNGAADLGGAIMLDDSSKVTIVNNTVANNVSTGSSRVLGRPAARRRPGARGQRPAVAGEAGTSRSTRRGDPPDFSNPMALFNNIFWNNNAYTLEPAGPGATLVNHGFIDFEIHGTTNNADTVHPAVLRPDQQPDPGSERRAARGAGRPGQHRARTRCSLPPFVTRAHGLRARGSTRRWRRSPSPGDPPVGLTGDYHLGRVSPASTRGCALREHRRCRRTLQPRAGAAAGSAAPTGSPADIDDGESRPNAADRADPPDAVGSRRGRSSGIPVPPDPATGARHPA